MTTQVELLRVQLTAPPTARDWTYLSAGERGRAERMITESHRFAFVQMRSSLRAVLADKLSETPERIQFEYTSTGKPSIRGAPWHFNISHTNGIGLIALRACSPVGVDIERYQPLPDHVALADRYFCDNERRHLSTIADASRLTVFYRYWTRKEAMIKALGQSFAEHSSEIDVATVDDNLPPQLSARLSESYGTTWAIRDITTLEGATAAVAGREPLTVRELDGSFPTRAGAH